MTKSAASAQAKTLGDEALALQAASTGGDGQKLESLLAEQGSLKLATEAATERVSKDLAELAEINRLLAAHVSTWMPQDACRDRAAAGTDKKHLSEASAATLPEMPPSSPSTATSPEIPPSSPSRASSCSVRSTSPAPSWLSSRIGGTNGRSHSRSASPKLSARYDPLTPPIYLKDGSCITPSWCHRNQPSSPSWSWVHGGAPRCAQRDRSPNSHSCLDILARERVCDGHSPFQKTVLTGRRVNCLVGREGLAVRVGGGWQNVEEFFNRRWPLDVPGVPLEHESSC
eukprot:gnl/TRDRNA2_/TRDRNA2_93468_c2_seq1.p1 gnl/TRDRNA2_/TRDRNA2_93468_c2~~gnl/TRDRNA2_/TRDRNA2_93468_c2_seq1.p1  ORF type:complete len:327 (+),score=44.12 gnl/TRDRNA2_/TRDRNA2_93468_c2_seq1:124-981(+)